MLRRKTRKRQPSDLKLKSIVLSVEDILCIKKQSRKVTSMFNRKEKKEKKERTYSIKGIFSELKQVKWPTFKSLSGYSGLVLLFVVVFGFYFFLCDLVASGLLQVLVG